MYRVILFSVSICVALSAIPSLIFDFGNWTEFVVRTAFGVSFGLLIAPEIEKELFQAPVLFQSLAGICCGGILANLLSAPVVGVLIGAVVGFGVGFTARCWIKHIPLP